MLQFIARGIVGYAPLVGTPSPADLHAEDIAFLHLILTGLGAQSSTERSSLTALRCVGGLQLPSVVECVTGAVASELMFFLNGRILAYDIARDSLKDAMYADPNSIDFTYGLVLQAMAFLAGHGIYATVATDKLFGRMLDNYACKRKVHGHPLLGSFNSYVFKIPTILPRWRYSQHHSVGYYCTSQNRYPPEPLEDYERLENRAA